MTALPDPAVHLRASIQAAVDSVIDGRSSCAPPASAPVQGTIMLHILHRLAWVLGVLMLASTAAVAQGYPTRIVTVVVATPPGGQPDILARLIADRLSRAFPYRFIVENRVGANGNLAPAHVAKQAPDGHTLFVGSAPFLINPSLYGDLSFDVFRDFKPIAFLGAAPTALIVNPSFPAKTLAELVDHVRKNPGQPWYASPGAATASRITFELFKRQANIDVAIVPYRGAGPVFNDVLAGHVPMTIAQPEVVAAMVQEGRLRALAVSSKDRAPLLPDVPTYGELGYPIVRTVWSGLFAPAGTPESIIQRLNAEARKALTEPEVRDILDKLGIVVDPMTPDQLGQLVASEVASYREIVKAAGITAEQ
jgi:tripartite-type tricarboxylate transporter receptor subunit TctC